METRREAPNQPEKQRHRLTAASSPPTAVIGATAAAVAVAAVAVFVVDVGPFVIIVKSITPKCSSRTVQPPVQGAPTHPLQPLPVQPRHEGEDDDPRPPVGYTCHKVFHDGEWTPAYRAADGGAASRQEHVKKLLIPWDNRVNDDGNTQ